MNNTKYKNTIVFSALALLMAATRFSHFGSTVNFPDASLAIFFLGGLYLSWGARSSIAAFAALIVEAGMIDLYATSVEGVSDWCMTPAYWFLVPIYGGLWLAGRWFALRHTMKGLGLVSLSLVAWGACSFAFIFSNATFYLFSEHFLGMRAVEYASSVVQFYSSYVSVALLYIACAVALHMVFDMLLKQYVQSGSEVA